MVKLSKLTSWPVPMAARSKPLYNIVQHKLIGFYYRDEKCLQRGTDWVFK